MVSSNTVCMKSMWKGGFIHFFRRKARRLFKDFPGPYFDTFNQAKCFFFFCWKLCFGYKHAHMQKCQTRRAWKYVQTRHSLCISGSISQFRYMIFNIFTCKIHSFILLDDQCKPFLLKRIDFYEMISELTRSNWECLGILNHGWSWAHAKSFRNEYNFFG